ncbi:MAG TPA: SulP family inorganic anion transporter, partial [Phenylobacterium sp.]|nr:SulP family inorganic anion transporter [Phenylobacterium sp.]
MPDGSSTSHLFRPKLATVLGEHYSWTSLRHDAAAGLTVAVVALPLSMAIAVASGVSPDRGLYTAIVGGFLVSLLGGSRFQIGGPAGAFIVLMATTQARFGLDGLVLAVAMSGVMLTLMGISRVGGLIRHIPHAVTVGFTAAIAVTIVASQLTNLGGLRLAGAEPGPFFPKLAAILSARGSVNPNAVVIGVAVAAMILVIRRYRPTWPGMLLAVVAAAFATWGLGLPVETLGSRFGALASNLPTPHLPAVS